MPSCYEFNYTSNEPQPLPDVWVACPSGDNCCIGADLCLSNNICHVVSSSTGKRESGYSSYYNARCTDPTYTNPACDKICIGSPPDIVYNYTSERWACCGNDTAGEVTCFNPLHEYYEAPAPNSLATLSAGASFDSSATLTPWAQYAATAVTTATVVSSTVSQTTAMSTTSATSSATASHSASGSLSIGAEAGIGVGVALGIIAPVAIVMLFWRRRRRPRSRAELTTDWTPRTDMREPAEKYSKPHVPVYEMGNDAAVYEVGSRR